MEVSESHARLLFSVLLFRDGSLPRGDLENELVSAFGPRVGDEIAHIIAGAFACAAPPRD